MRIAKSGNKQSYLFEKVALIELPSGYEIADSEFVPLYYLNCPRTIERACSHRLVSLEDWQAGELVSLASDYFQIAAKGDKSVLELRQKLPENTNLRLTVDTATNNGTRSFSRTYFYIVVSPY